MASAGSNFAAVNAAVLYSAAQVETKNLAALEALDSAGNLINGITDIGELTAEGSNIEFAVYGEEYSSSIPGQKSPGTFDMTVAMDFSDTIHTALRDDDGKTTHTFIVKFEVDGTNKTYAAFDGRVLSSTLSMGAGDVTTMNVSIARLGGATFVDDDA